MKKIIFKGSCLLLLIASYNGIAQREPQIIVKKAAEVTKYTVMERFEPQLILSAEERLKLKEERVAEIERRRQILDTMDISKRKKEKLMNDILKNPFSQRLSKTLAEIEFEDENK